MAGEENGTGLYKKVRCPNCGYSVPLTIMVYQLPSRRKRIQGLIESILSHQEYKKFLELTTKERIVFAVEKFYDTYGESPSEVELSKFTGLTIQTVSKYISNNEWVSSEPQRKGIDGRYEKKKFYLSDEGKRKYSELTYKIVGYA